MADKKFGLKRICPYCEKKFYDLNKKSPFTCPCGEKEVAIEEDTFFSDNTAIIQQQSRNDTKDEFADIDNAENSENGSDDEVISLDDAALEEEQDSKS